MFVSILEMSAGRFRFVVFGWCEVIYFIIFGLTGEGALYSL